MKFESSHPGGEGKTLVQKIQDKADRATRDWIADRARSSLKSAQSLGRVEGVCSALGILRGSSTQEEMRLSSERVAES
jgi:hypothetical protein